MLLDDMINPNVIRQNIDDSDDNSDHQFDYVINNGPVDIRINNNSNNISNSSSVNVQPESEQPQNGN